MNTASHAQCGSIPPSSNTCAHANAYLDMSNIWISGAQVSAARLGMAASPSAAAQSGVFDRSYRLNFGSLRRFVVGGVDSARTICVGSLKAGGCDCIGDATQQAGWQTTMQVRAKSGREKAVDTSLSVFMVEDLLTTHVDPSEMDVTLLSGDRDLLPAVEAVMRRGFAVDVVAWDHSASTELRQIARRFISLDSYFNLLTFRKDLH